MPLWMWGFGIVGFAWVVMGAIKKPKPKRGPRINLDDHLDRLDRGDDEEVAVLADDPPAKKTRAKKPKGSKLVSGYEYKVAGVSRYQRELERICGGRSELGFRIEILARLVCEDSNAFDDQAVMVEIEGRKVGYLSRDDAREFRAEIAKTGIGYSPVHVKAIIVGGWDRGDGDRGHFGVRLWIYD